MNFSSLWQWVGGQSRRRGASRRQRRKGQSRPRILRPTLLDLERLEDRTLLSSNLPSPTVTGQVDVSNIVGNNSSSSSPSIAIDPTNPLKMAVVYTNAQDIPGATTNPVVSVMGDYSNDGGHNWLPMSFPVNLIDPSTSNPVLPYAQSSDATVAFDRNHDIYVTYTEHSTSGQFGALVLQKYNFGSAAPVQTISNSAIYQWAFGFDNVLKPVVAVDNNLPTFGTQNDPHSGTVYVAWGTDYKPPTPPNPNFNPNTIQIVASSDGGLGFSAPLTLNSAGIFGPQRDGSPQIAISQGTPNGVVQPGLVSVVWDDFGTGSKASPVFSQLTNRELSGADTQVFTQTLDPTTPPNPITDAQTGNPNIPAVTTYTQTIDLTTDKSFTTLSKLDVTLSIISPDMSDKSITLTAPDGTVITLLRAHTNPDGSTNTGQGITGQNMGVSTVNGANVGTTFDMDAPYAITSPSVTAPYLGTFQPDFGFTDNNLNALVGENAKTLSGLWTLNITDNRNNGNTPEPQDLLNWSLQLTSGLSPTTPVDQILVRTSLLGSKNNTYPTKIPSNPVFGVNSAPVIASDNSLGTHSPHAGRIYIAYTDQVNTTTTPTNQPGNTDIFLIFSDDGGRSWSTNNPIQVNDDNGATDGFSGAFSGFLGRSQYDANMAVDPATGQLVLSFFDARNDAANARVATYIAVSSDGGQTFAPEVYANAPQTVIDAITGKTVVVGPIPDNESAGNTGLPDTESKFGFGTHEGLAVYDGHVYPVWASNQNGGLTKPSSSSNSPILLNIFTAPTVISTGPRVISSTMGPVNSGVFSSTGVQELTNFEVDFDRPVDILSFDKSQVQVVYRDVNTPATQPGTPVSVASVTALDPDGSNTTATKFLVTFTTPQSAVGTYSYLIGPNIRNDIPYVSSILTPDTSHTENSTLNNQPIPDATSSQSPGELDNTITVSDFGADKLVSSMTVTVNITHTFDPDLQLYLVGPDGVTQVALALNEGFGAGSEANYTNTTFSDSASTSISDGSPPFNGSFRPEQPLSALARQSADGVWTLRVVDTNPFNTGNLVNWSMTINSGTPGDTIVAGNLMDQYGNANTGPVHTYETPRPLGNTPFQPPYDQNTLPIIIPGPHIVGSFVSGNPATSDNLVLNGTANSIDIVFDRDMNPNTITAATILRMMGPLGQINGPFTVTADPNPNYSRLINGVMTTAADPDPTHPRTYKITFPTQSLSGTYTFTLASSIQDTLGEALDTNENAGLAVLRGTDPNSGQTIQTTVNLGNTSPLAIGPQKTINSTIKVATNVVIKSLTVQLNITCPNDPDLSASLIAPNGTIIKLFTNVGQSANPQNFTNTVLDDSAVAPIQTGLPPFNGRFNPQQPLEVLAGTSAQGTWTLQIANKSTTNTSFLNATQGGNSGWGLTFTSVVPGTGLGEPVADQAEASFRIFTMDPTNPLSHTTWTPVGPASENSGGNSGRVTGLAVDPSDPSGNTVYAGGASGGIWKTTDFLTTNPNGPTWIPLTNFGPTFAMNTGGIAVFGRNNDPNQSIVVVSTGEGDTGTQGVGFLLSTDGGASWKLLDSTTNVDANGNPLPINSPSRDHVFVGMNSFKVLVDPTAAPGGGVIIYAAFSGKNGGIWRSLDTGNHWQNMRPGQATDVAFAPDSATAPTNNIQVLYAGFQGEGVFLSPNQGQTWNIMAGTTGDPLIQDDISSSPVKVGTTPSPNGAKGRISLAAPVLTGSPLVDKQFEGWLYALVATSAGAMDGLYVTKDFGQNWTKVALSLQKEVPAPKNPLDAGIGVPTNDIKQPSASVIGSTLAPQGNYDQSVAIDPTNPNIVYVGGTDDFQPFPQGGFVRVDISQLHDAHSLVPYDNSQADGGKLQFLTDPTAAAARTDETKPSFLDSTGLNYTNLIRDPNSPFLSNATIYTFNYAQFNNDGSTAKWIPFNDITDGSTDQHRLLTMVDPLTGHARLILADDQGVFSGVDNNGTVDAGIGNAKSPSTARNGNLQILQMYDGASQPSVLASDIAGALFYGNAQDDGQPQSDPNILQDGNIGWTGPTGDGTGVATDQTGSGTAYHYNWPCCGGNLTDFFQVTLPGSGPIGRTFGLLQQSNPPPNIDPQWPFTGGSRFAVNPINGNQIVMSSQAGRIFRTQDQGVTWFVIGNPTDLDSTYAGAMAYGAPLPNAIGNTDNFIYAGTNGGHIFVTFTGGGNGTTNQWTSISTGLDGSAVQEIVTDPVRGTHDAYAVTLNGVYYMADSSVSGAKWVNITGNVFKLTEPVLGVSTDQQTPLKYLTTIQADWRSANLTKGVPPVLYVGGEGGVFRSTNRGTTWTIFPSTTDGAAVNGGYLPLAHVTKLDLSLGNINPTTGLPDQSTGVNLLIASTYGRGDYAIRLPNGAIPGPRVMGLKVLNNSTIQINFSGAVDPSSFSVADVNSLTAPDGTAITVTGVQDVTAGTLQPGQPNFHNIWNISFAPQTKLGVYVVNLGPNITDFPGNKMDQNFNGIDGENPGDTYTGRFYLNPATGTGGPYAQGFFGQVQGTGAIYAGVTNGVNGFMTTLWAGNAPVNLVDVVTGNFTGDGLTDIAGMDPNTGVWWVGVSNGSSFTFTPWTAWVVSPNVTWVDVRTGNFVGDGKTDIVARWQQTGQWYVNVSNGNSFTPSLWATWSPAVTWADVLAADFNGDGKTDLTGRVLQSGQWWVGLSSGGSFNTQSTPWTTWSPNVTWADVQAADFNGDGKMDIVGRWLQAGQWYVGLSNGTNSFNTTLWATWSAAPGVTWVDVHVGDFTGDGKADIVGRWLQGGQWYVGTSTGSAFNTSLWATWSNAVTWSDVMVGDFNGDGKLDIVGRVLQSGQWYEGASTGTAFQTALWATWSPAVVWANVLEMLHM